MKKLNFKFKGSRNYVHGSDIFNSIVEHLEPSIGGHLLKLTFKGFARSHLEINFGKPASSDKMMASGKWVDSTGIIRDFYLIELDLFITESYPFDEDSIVVQSFIFDKHILSDNNNEYSIIENIIALTKKLNYYLSPRVQGKWLFAQLDLVKGLPRDWKRIEISQTVNTVDRFSRNQILIDDENFGEIHFIVGQP